jgi:hypothetical protein
LPDEVVSSAIINSRRRGAAIDTRNATGAEAALPLTQMLEGSFKGGCFFTERCGA